MSAASAASPGLAQWVRGAAAGAGKRHCSWSARAGLPSRRAPRACPRHPPRCLAPLASPPPGIRDTTAWNIEMRVRWVHTF
ncbi:hypothetical protein B5X24_HaOG216595 [Helicoverpa armigera]|nr:hypothetical protein B5X24_HaOG216595 [Helicoverpa armigera]